MKVGGVDEDTIRNIENVTGGSGNDILVGDGLANMLDGGLGDDLLTGAGDVDFSENVTFQSDADVDVADGAEVDVIFETRETDEDPAGAPVWSEWGRVDSHEIEARAIEARAWLRTSDTGYSPRVTKLRLYADEVSP